MKTWLRDNGLTIALSLLFLGSCVGQMISGFAHENEERLQHGLVRISFPEFLKGGPFFSTLFEN